MIQEQIKKKGESVFSIFVERRLHHQYRYGSLAFVTGVGTAMMTKSASLIRDGSVVASILLPGVAFSSSTFLPVAAVPDGTDMFGEVLRQGQSDIPEADDTDGFVQDGSRCQETDSTYNWIILFIFNNRKIYRNWYVGRTSGTTLEDLPGIPAAGVVTAVLQSPYRACFGVILFRGVRSKSVSKLTRISLYSSAAVNWYASSKSRWYSAIE